MPFQHLAASSSSRTFPCESFRLLKDKFFVSPLAKQTVCLHKKAAMFDSTELSGWRVILAPSCNRNSVFQLAWALERVQCISVSLFHKPVSFPLDRLDGIALQIASNSHTECSSPCGLTDHCGDMSHLCSPWKYVTYFWGVNAEQTIDRTLHSFPVAVLLSAQLLGWVICQCILAVHSGFQVFQFPVELPPTALNFCLLCMAIWSKYSIFTFLYPFSKTIPSWYCL